MLLSAKEFPLSQWYQPDTAKSYFWLGRVQREAGDLTTALESVQLSLRLRKELLGDHPDTADDFHEQGVIYHAMNDYKSAVEAFQKAASSAYGYDEVLTNQSAAKFLSTNQNRAFRPCDLLTSQMPIYGHGLTRDPME